MSAQAQTWIRHLGLQPHPEGGYFRETYRSAEAIDGAHLPARYGHPRCFSTAIYFLLEGHEFSTFHRLKSDEIWHFYAGCALDVWIIEPSGALRSARVGPDPMAKHHLQFMIPAGVWFAAQPVDTASFSLIGCTVAPGFDFADFELATRAELVQQFPQHRDLIQRLTRA